MSLERVEELAGKTVNFHNVDISDAEALDKIFKLVSRLKSLFHEFKRSNFHLFFCFFQYRFDCVIHLAALKSVGDSCSLPLDYYRNNVAGTITLLEVNEEQDVVVVVKDGGVIINSPTVSCPSLSKGNEKPPSREIGLFVVGHCLRRAAIFARRRAARDWAAGHQSLRPHQVLYRRNIARSLHF